MNRIRFIQFPVILLTIFVLWGCPKSAEMSSSEETPAAAPAVSADESAKAAEAQKAEDDRKATEAAAAKAAEEAKAAEDAKEKERAAAASTGLQPIYFDFDKSFVRDDAKAAMKGNADWLKANPKAKVRIEGNCDERGTKEYNQALGQRRASSAKKYLTDLGISAKRILLISYGKEKQVCSENAEECWQKNRKDDFVAVTE